MQGQARSLDELNIQLFKANLNIDGNASEGVRVIYI